MTQFESKTMQQQYLQQTATPTTYLTSSNTNNIQQIDDIKIQIYYAGVITVIYLKETTPENGQFIISLDKFYQKIRQICIFEETQPFTLKWVDEEGDPCSLNSQMELDEAIRLYYLNKESELILHVFPNVPEKSGHQCAGEDRSIYRRGARRWRKFYLVNGHKYQAKRFARTALCKVCHDRIWGLGKQGYKCLECKIMVHKRCHKFITTECNDFLMQQHNNNINNNQSFSPGLMLNSNNNKPKITSSATLSSISSNLSPTNDSNLRTSQKFIKNQANNHSISKKFSSVQLTPSQSSSSSSFRNNQQNLNIKNSADHSPLSKSSSTYSNNNNLIPISYNELEVNDISYTKSTDEDGDDENLNYNRNNNATAISNKSSINNNNLNSSQNKKSNLSSNKTTTVKATTTNQRQMSLDDFDLIKVIGRGSYAKVFLVEYKRTRKCYAMKVIKKSKVNDDEDIDWVQTEKHIFEQATNHPFLVGLHSCFQSESNLFFVIEYLCGGDLMYHMQRKCKLPEDHARFYSAEIVLALDFLHSRGIIYRDLKLDNVLLDLEGHIKLTDYGMCKEGLKKGELTSTFCGTPNYIAPEMLRGESYDFSVDWWALGVLCFEMMAGRTPFNINENASENPDLNTEDHLFQVILEKPIRIPRNLSAKANSLLKCFLQKSPAERLGSLDGLREIQQHIFYKSIDWNLLEQRLIQPPYKPQVTSERDLSNIDELFTKEEVCLTPETPRTLARIQQNEFEGFEYINPLILSEELSV